MRDLGDLQHAGKKKNHKKNRGKNPAQMLCLTMLLQVRVTSEGKKEKPAIQVRRVGKERERERLSLSLSLFLSLYAAYSMVRKKGTWLSNFFFPGSFFVDVRACVGVGVSRPKTPPPPPI